MRSLLLSLVACCVSVPCWSQTPAGRIAGWILDPSGAAVPQVQVEARHLETGRRRLTKSDEAGVYRFAVLPVGNYELTPSAPKFVGRPRRVRLEVGRHLNVDLSLSLETEQVKVTVTDSTPLVDPENAALGAVISRETLADLPLNQREFLQLALLSAGALPAAPGSELERQNNSGLHLSGAREASNNFLLDGVDNNDLYINRIVVSPPLDSVREFRLHAANYQAEYGRSGGAQINVVTQSGTNRLHGSFYEYLRNDALDARNFFDPAGEPIPPIQAEPVRWIVGRAHPARKDILLCGVRGHPNPGRRDEDGSGPDGSGAKW